MEGERDRRQETDTCPYICNLRWASEGRAVSVLMGHLPLCILINHGDDRFFSRHVSTALELLLAFICISLRAFNLFCPAL